MLCRFNPAPGRWHRQAQPTGGRQQRGTGPLTARHAQIWGNDAREAGALANARTMDAYADNPCGVLRRRHPRRQPWRRAPRSSWERETRITEDLIACRAFSSKPAGGDLDYQAEVMAYVKIWLGLVRQQPFGV